MTEEGGKEWIDFMIRIMLKALEDANVNTVIKYVLYTRVAVSLASMEVFLPQ